MPGERRRSKRILISKGADTRQEKDVFVEEMVMPYKVYHHHFGDA